jgi:hypothetical protein
LPTFLGRICDQVNFIAWKLIWKNRKIKKNECKKTGYTSYFNLTFFPFNSGSPI